MLKVLLTKSHKKQINAVKSEWGNSEDSIAKILLAGDWIIVEEEKEKTFIPKEIFMGLLEKERNSSQR